MAFMSGDVQDKGNITIDLAAAMVSVPVFQIEGRFDPQPVPGSTASLSALHKLQKLVSDGIAVERIMGKPRS